MDLVLGPEEGFFPQISKTKLAEVPNRSGQTNRDPQLRNRRNLSQQSISFIEEIPAFVGKP
jgi:hypothetical protein